MQNRILEKLHPFCAAADAFHRRRRPYYYLLDRATVQETDARAHDEAVKTTISEKLTAKRLKLPKTTADISKPKVS